MTKLPNLPNSQELFSEAKTVFPGGVNSPVRAFRAVGGQPPFIARGEGAYLYDEDHRRYVDYVLSWGPLILGHTHPEVVEAIRDQAAKGTSFGAPTKLETTLAREVMALIPSIEMIRFVNSGTEATMSALRLARAYSGREKIIKFEGCYHGHADMLLVQAGSGVATLGLPDSPGVPAGAARDTLVAPYNNLAAVAAIFNQLDEQIAAVILEPVAGNMGVVPPAEGFLEGLRSLCDQYGALLIFDEVMTGFRVSLGGAQAVYGVQPDLTCLGKVIGGGLPVGAYGGRSAIMEMVAPAGPMYQAGTLSGNPLAMRAGLATLHVLRRPGLWDELERKSAALAAGIEEAAQDAGIPVFQARAGTMFATFFTGRPVTDWASAKQCDTGQFARFFRGMLDRGVYLAPSQFEAGFMSAAHSDDDIAQTVEAARHALA